MGVDERLPRDRNLGQLISAGRHLGQARTDREHEIGLLDASSELRVDRDAHVPDVLRMIIVEEILKAESAGDGKLPVFCKSSEFGAGLGGPTAAAENRDRPPLFGQYL